MWSENIHGGGAPNFLTGMGGLLQTVLFGYGGLRLESHRIALDPVLPPDCHEMKFMGIDYCAHTLDINVTENKITLVVTSMGDGDKEQLCLCDSLGHKTVLELGQIISTERKPLFLKMCKNIT